MNEILTCYFHFHGIGIKFGKLYEAMAHDVTHKSCDHGLMRDGAPGHTGQSGTWPGTMDIGRPGQWFHPQLHHGELTTIRCCCSMLKISLGYASGAHFEFTGKFVIKFLTRQEIFQRQFMSNVKDSLFSSEHM